MVASRPTLRDARKFVKTVENTFKDKCETYNTFLKVMKDYRIKRIDRDGVRSNVKQLFKDHQELLSGFNQFLPKGYKIILESDLGEALGFLRKFKARLRGDDRAYKILMDTLVMYIHDEKSINEVYDEVTILFRGHQDLFVEFQHFFPRK